MFCCSTAERGTPDILCSTVILRLGFVDLVHHIASSILARLVAVSELSEPSGRVHPVCRKTCLLSRFSAPSLCVTSPCGALIGPPTAFRRNGPSVPWVGVLAGFHWGDDSSRVMSHQSANPLWLCRVSDHRRDRGHDLSVGRRSYTHSSSTPPRLVSWPVEFTSRLLMNLCSRVSSTAPLRVQVDIRVRELELSGIRGVSRHRSGPVRPDSSRARVPSPR